MDSGIQYTLDIKIRGGNCPHTKIKNIFDINITPTGRYRDPFSQMSQLILIIIPNSSPANPPELPRNLLLYFGPRNEPFNLDLVLSQLKLQKRKID